MGLLDELTALEGTRKPTGGAPCRLAVILGSMSTEESAALARLLDGSTTYATQIAATLKAHGHEVNAAQIGHHRRRVRGGGCSCPLPDEAA